MAAKIDEDDELTCVMLTGTNTISHSSTTISTVKSATKHLQA